MDDCQVYRVEWNRPRKLCTKLAIFTRLYRDAGQQNIKFIILYGKITAADYKNHPKYTYLHHNRRSGVRPWSVLSRLIFYSEAFPIVFVHSVHISTLFFSSCCHTFLLRVVANLICIFSVSRQPVLLTRLPEFLRNLVVKKAVPLCTSDKLHTDWCQWFIYFFLRVQISFPHRRIWRAVNYIYIYIQGVTGGTDQTSGGCSLC